MHGFNCATPPTFHPSNCSSVVGRKCKLGSTASVSFLMAWTTRWVAWEVTSNTAAGGEMQFVKGNVLPENNEILQNTTTVNLQSMAAVQNDTTSGELLEEGSSKGITTGFHVYPLPYTSPTTLQVNSSGAGLGSGNIATADWELDFVLEVK